MCAAMACGLLPTRSIGGASSTALACVSLVGAGTGAKGRKTLLGVELSLRTQCSVGQKVGQNNRAQAKGPSVILAGVCRLCLPNGVLVASNEEGQRRTRRHSLSNTQGLVLLLRIRRCIYFCSFALGGKTFLPPLPLARASSTCVGQGTPRLRGHAWRPESYRGNPFLAVPCLAPRGRAKA